MQNKFKKCKGTGKALGHGCEEMQLITTYGLGHQCGCYYKWLRETPEGQEKVKKSIINAKKQVKKQKIKEEREKKANYDKLLTEKIQEIIRLIDYGQPCLARGTKELNNQAGHVFAKGGNPALKWNLHNIHRQSKNSNYLHEDVKLRKGIEKEYGKNYLSFIDSFKIIQSLKLTNEDKKEAYNKSKKIANDLKKDSKVYSLKERINLRNKINKELNIYPNRFIWYF